MRFWVATKKTKELDLTPEELKIYRVNQNLTQKQLSTKAGVDQSQVSRWEAGRQKIPACVVKLIQCWEENANT